MIALKDKGPLLPDVWLYHDRKKAIRRMRKFGPVDSGNKDAGAITYVNGSTFVVAMMYNGDETEENALLVHESVHIVRLYFSNTLMEEHAGEEIYAYATQMVSYALMNAHKKWKRKRVRK